MAETGLEMDFRSRLFRAADFFEITHRNAALESNLMNRSVTPHFNDQPFGKKVHDTDTNPVQTCGVLIGIVVKLATGVKHWKIPGRQGRNGIVACKYYATVFKEAWGLVSVEDPLWLRNFESGRRADNVPGIQETFSARQALDASI